VEEKPKILLVDDEVRILRSLGLLLRMQYQVFATSDGNEALDILAREHIHVLISDQRMPIMTGTELLSRARKVSPKTVRILLTGYADAAAVEDSVNEAEIFRYINKPWGPPSCAIPSARPWWSRSRTARPWRPQARRQQQGQQLWQRRPCPRWTIRGP